MENAFLNLAVYALPIFLTLTIPIAFQAWVANRLGDSTPRTQGRLSWDPIRHMDWLGTVVLPTVFLMLSGGFGGGGFLIGWAKSLEIDVRRLQGNMKLFLVEMPLFVGPLVMAILWVLFAKLLGYAGVHETFVSSVSSAGVNVGLSFFAIALLPFPPMPLGNAILRNMPAKYLYKLLPFFQYAPFIIIALLVLGVLNPFLRAVFGVGAVIVKMATVWL